ncbi:MAG TPA: hypothetical protein VK811_07290, partial [Candidatus Acidoferrum sp.]|nr:hypothetical protein [Candidatus Acidoferrum sp.]
MKSSIYVFTAILGCALPLHADEITCASCEMQGSLRGDYAHHKDSHKLRIEGAGNNSEAYREDVEGTNFTVSIAHLPAGKYTIDIGETETVYLSPGERVFAVS